MADSMHGNPSFDCIAGHHLFVDALDGQGHVVCGWCVWCGTGVYDPERVTDDGVPVGFVPNYRLRVPDGFTRSEVSRG